MEDITRTIGYEELLDKGVDNTPFVHYIPPGVTETIYIGRLAKMLKKFPESREKLDYEVFRCMCGAGQKVYDDTSPSALKNSLIQAHPSYKEKRFVTI